MNKKIVWLPYDFDTSLGINNEGALVFDYNLEDIDQTSGGADVYNGQQSVFWQNLRNAYYDQIKAMYQELRSTGAWSYAKVEQMFEEHQNKWPEAIFNEDAWYKYLAPLVEKGSAAYISMLQGSKTEQRKWWMYNRFRYIDSKYNAGDALTDVITLRGYAKDSITITPYADIYATIKYGSYLVQARAQRNQSYTLINPLDNVNDTEVYLYSASQLASIGDISGLKVGYAEFANAIRLQDLKIGDASPSYSNGNLKELYLGNNVLLKKIDVRNCPNLAQAVDLSGCSNIEEAYFDGTSITGLSLPVGGFLKKLHVPGTMASLVIRNHKTLTELVMPSYSSLTSLRLENIGTTVDSKSILMAMTASARVRLIGFYWEATDADEIDAIFDKFDLMRGLDEYGNNTDKAQLSGTIHTASLTGAQIAAYNARYKDVKVIADHTTSYLTFATYDGTDTIATNECYDGVMQGTAPAGPARAATEQYEYTFVGWSKTMDAETADADALTNVIADRTVYAAYSRTLRTYTVTWQNTDGTELEVDTDVPFGTVPTYNGATPTYDGQTSTGWLPDPTVAIAGDTTYTAQYKPVYAVTFKDDTGSTTLDTQRVVEGGTATYGGTTPTSSEDASLAFLGWATAANSHTANAVLTNIQASMTVYAAFESAIDVSEITDTWDQIIASIDAGTYSTKYKLGQYKPLDLGDEGIINMQIVGMDVDPLADGTGYAPLTFIGMELLNTPQSLANSTIYAQYRYASSMRGYLANTILPLIRASNQNLAARIQNVLKQSPYMNGTTVYTDGFGVELWIPSGPEVGVLDIFKKPTNIPVYTKVYDNDATRIKVKAGSQEASAWWVRNGYGNRNTYSYITTDGSARSMEENHYSGICLGFCLGLERETITDSWETILANQNYATDYSIGDTKMINLGTEGKHLMEIVAFDTDIRADDSTKTAGITWISRDVLPTAHVMNDSATTLDGWSASALRDYLRNTIKPLIPETIRNAIIDVSKVQLTYQSDGIIREATTSDDVWIPSYLEVVGTGRESSGVRYSDKFSTAVDRIKFSFSRKVNSSWWLRSVYNYQSFNCITASGNSSTGRGGSNDGIALGFCTN